jgi:hypothetical protein
MTPIELGQGRITPISSARRTGSRRPPCTRPGAFRRRHGACQKIVGAPSSAFNNLSLIYRRSRRCRRHPVPLFRRGVEPGDSGSMVSLGDLVEDGRVPPMRPQKIRSSCTHRNGLALGHRQPLVGRRSSHGHKKADGLWSVLLNRLADGGDVGSTRPRRRRSALLPYHLAAIRLLDVGGRLDRDRAGAPR